MTVEFNVALFTTKPRARFCPSYVFLINITRTFTYVNNKTNGMYNIQANSNFIRVFSNTNIGT